MSIYEKIARNFKEGLALGPTYPLRHVSWLLGKKYHVANIKGAGVVHIRPKSSDGPTFLQIFWHKEYDLSHFRQFPRIMEAYKEILNSGKNPVIIDAGANVGAATIWFAQQFPESCVIAIEPDAENAKICRMNTQNLSNVTLIEAAIGSEQGHVSLSNPKNQAWSIQTVRNDDGGVTVLTIPGIVSHATLPAKLFLIKIDIEGFEDDLFAKNTGWIDETNIIIIEPHDWRFPGKGTSRNLQKEMATRDFELLISGENLVYVRRQQ